MKYYSDVTKKIYNTEDDLNKAEKAVSEKETSRKEDAEKVKAAFDELAKAREKADNLLDEFLKKYGSFHTTIKTVPKKNEFSLFDPFWDFFL